MRLYGIAVLAVVAIACRSKKSEPSISLETTAFERCLDAMNAEGHTPAVERVLEACSPACAAGADLFVAGHSDDSFDEDRIWRGLVECGLTCTAGSADRLAEKRLSQRLPTLAGTCGAAYYDLPGGFENQLTDTTFVLGRIHRWLERSRPLLPAALQERVDRATEAAHFIVPPPSSIDGVYSLAPSSAAVPFRQKFYVVVAEDGLRAAATPIARMLGKTLEFRPVPGGAPPGAPLDTARARTELDELEASWAAHHPASDERRYAYLADGGRAVHDLVAAARRLGHDHFLLGVSGLSTRTHRIRLELDKVTAAPVLQIRDGNIAFPEAPEGSVTTSLRDALIERAPTSVVEVQITDATTVADLIRALDIIAAADGSAAILRAP